MELIPFILFILIFVIGFGVSIETFIGQTPDKNYWRFINSIKQVFYPIFGDIQKVKTSITKVLCNSETFENCTLYADNKPIVKQTIVSVYLPIFILCINLLIMNIIIAIFS